MCVCVCVCVCACERACACACARAFFTHLLNFHFHASGLLLIQHKDDDFVLSSFVIIAQQSLEPIVTLCYETKEKKEKEKTKNEYL